MKYCELVLDGVLHETAPPGRSLTGASTTRAQFRFDRFLAGVEALLRNQRVTRVLVHRMPGFRPQAHAGYEMIHAQIKRLTSAGKEVWFYAEQYAVGDIYMASAATRRVLHPLGTFQALGLSRSFLFFRKALHERKLQVEVFRRGRYKGALDSISNDRLDHAQREQHNELLSAVVNEFQDRIAEGYRRPLSDLGPLTGGKILTAREAYERAWVHHCSSYSELVGDWRDKKFRKIEPKVSDKGFGRGKTVAVVYLEGTIVTGSSRSSSIFGRSLGAATVCEQLSRLERNRRVKAVVLRINSGGGSATASESIVHAVERLKRTKPVVVSMGEVAASGGYWIATQAQRLFVEHTTITGSIGVLMAVLNLREFLKTRGITEDTVKTHEHADLAEPFRRLTNDERQQLDEIISKLYYAFLKRVAEFRERSVADIDRVAEGRVWTGYDAVRLGLADEVGGLSEAIEYVRRIHTGSCRVRYIPRARRSVAGRLLARSLGTGAHAFGARLGFREEVSEVASGAAGDAFRSAWLDCVELHRAPLALWTPVLERILGAVATELCSGGHYR